MSSMALTSPTPDPNALPGTGGAAVDPSTGLPVQFTGSVVPNTMQLSRNPMLPQHPLGAYTDAQYEAAVAQLRADTMNKYNDLLRQLGYTDGNGNFVMGAAETAARQKQSEDQYQEDLARRDVTNQMQQAGTLFSGYRGQQEGEKTMPYEQDKAQIGIDLPNQLSQLYEQANGVLSDFVNQHNSLLADAAQRATQAAMNNNAGGVQTPSADTPPPNIPNITPPPRIGGTPPPITVAQPQPHLTVSPLSSFGPGTVTTGFKIPQYDPAAIASAVRRPGVQQ